MENKDMPAIPTPVELIELIDDVTDDVTDDFVKKCLGLTKREAFTFTAPDVPVSFAKEFAQSNKDDESLVVIFKSKEIYQLTAKGDMQLIKAWRYAYADTMLEE